MNEKPSAQSTVISIPVGALSVRMYAPLSAEELPDRITFWWGITSAAVALARYLEASGPLCGQSVVELGCGVGLAGVTAGLLGGAVTFTDYVEEALEFAQINSQLNGLRDDRTSFRLLDWENPGDPGQYCLILGSEVVYDYFFHGSLVNLLDRMATSNGRIVLADRKRLCVSRFLGRVLSRGFQCEQSIQRVVHKGFPLQDITIFSITRAVR